MNKTQLEFVGAALYKCEGTKLRKDKRFKNTYYYQIEFTNSDPYLMKLFLDFLRKILKIDENKLKCELFLYQDQKMAFVEKRWKVELGLKSTNFQKTIELKTKTTLFKPNPFGTCKLRYNSKECFLKLNEIIIKRLGIDANLIK